MSLQLQNLRIQGFEVFYQRQFVFPAGRCDLRLFAKTAPKINSLLTGQALIGIITVPDTGSGDFEIVFEMAVE